MNRRMLAILTVLSLAANGVLAFRAMRPAAVAATGSSAAASSEIRPAQGAAMPAPADADAARATPGVAMDWSTIESPDLAVLRDRLRAAGFPESHVRAIIWQRIQRSHHADKLAIIAARGEMPFFAPPDRAADRAMQLADRELDRRMRDEFKHYFDRGMGEDARARQARMRLWFLPEDKADEVTRVATDYMQMRRELQDDIYSAVQLPEDQQKLALLEQERRADLAAILSPEEFDLYELNTSQTANLMRSRLALFGPTEQEFRAIYALQSAFDQTYGMSTYGQPSREAMRARSQAQRQLGEQVAAVLGPQRYAEYQRATSYEYQTAVKITEHFKLPRENAAAVHGLEEEYRLRAQALIQSMPDRAQAAAAAEGLAAEASSRVTALLGEEGARVYRDAAGYWLRGLEREVARASTTRRP